MSTFGSFSSLFSRLKLDYFLSLSPVSIIDAVGWLSDARITGLFSTLSDNTLQNGTLNRAPPPNRITELAVIESVGPTLHLLEDSRFRLTAGRSDLH
jgi:hypothetical protein